MADDPNLVDAGTVESKRETTRTPRDRVRRWLSALDLVSKEEEKWRDSADRAIARYRDESDVNKQPYERTNTARFNILWANTEILRPALYARRPEPDVRRRYHDADPMGRNIAEMLERALSYTLDAYDFDQTINLAVLDYVLAGRSVVRVRYKPFNEAREVDGEQVEVKSYESVECEYVPWRRFRRGPGQCWADVSWIAYEHLLTRDDLVREFGDELGKRVALDVSYEVDTDKSREESSADLFERGRVWEIWDKERREISWVAPSIPEQELKVEEDRLGLEGFFDIPRPMYSVETTSSLVPVEEYRLYRDQAEELDRITRRIQKIIEACKVRGIYDAALKELGAIMRGEDNDLIPADQARGILHQTGGLDRHIWLMPIERLAQVLAQLYTQRDQIKQTIYEIIGLSDIMRGASDPNETLGAQQIKAQSGGLRLQRRQREVQRFIRDIIRIKAEIIAEQFDPTTMMVMTGRMVTPEMMEILRQDGPRGFRIDIETDSTVADELVQDKQAISELLGGIAQYFTAVAPAVQSGAFPMDVAKSILMAAIRRFKLGRQVEMAIEQASAPEADAMTAGAQGALPAPPGAQAQGEPAAPRPDQMEKVRVDQERLKVEAQEKNARAQFEVAKARTDAEYRDREISIKERDQKMRELEAAHKRDLELIDHQMNLIQAREQRNERIGQAAAPQLEAWETEMEELAKVLAQLTQMLAAQQQQLAAQQQQHHEEMMRLLAAPKELVRDKQGRAQGVRTVMQ